MCPVRACRWAAAGCVCRCPSGREVRGWGTCVVLPRSLGENGSGDVGPWGRGLGPSARSSYSSQAANRRRLYPREAARAGSVLGALWPRFRGDWGVYLQAGGSPGRETRTPSGALPSSSSGDCWGWRGSRFSRLLTVTHSVQLPAAGLKVPVAVPIRDLDAPFGFSLGPRPRGSRDAKSWVGQWRHLRPLLPRLPALAAVPAQRHPGLSSSSVAPQL